MPAEGSDISGVEDIDRAWRVVSGRLALAQAFARRLGTPRGSLPDWPDYGYDLVSAIGTSQTDSQIRQKVQEQATQEEEIEDIETSIERTQDGGVFLKIRLFDGDGPFEFTVNVSDLAIEAIIPGDL